MSKQGVFVVMPAYRSKALIKAVLDSVPAIVSQIIVIDDACPEGTGNYVKENFADKRVEVIFNQKTLVLVAQ